MNSRFKQFIKDLNAGNAEAKQRNLDELHKSFAALSQEDQSFARQFLNDVENGLAVEENKTCRIISQNIRQKAITIRLVRFLKVWG